VDIEGLNDISEQTITQNDTHTTACGILSTPDFVEKYSLNTEQTRIFRILQSHMERTFSYHADNGSTFIKPEQLLMYIGMRSRRTANLRNLFLHTH
jgi:hypothetical protein